MSGWISLHRKLMDNPIYSNADMLKLWIHCLLKASHTHHKQLVGTQLVELLPGQFVTGRDALALEFNAGTKKSDVVSASTLWRWLLLFEEMQMLNIKKTTKYSVVTIVNWGFYQNDEQQMDSEQTADEQQVNIKRTSNEQQMNTNNNGNKGNNDNKGNKNKSAASNGKRTYAEDSVYYQLALKLFEGILANNPDHRIRLKKEQTLQKWANDARLTMEQDKRTADQIAWLIDWSQKHSFWRINIQSVDAIRRQYDKMVAQVKSDRETKQLAEQKNNVGPIPEWFKKQKQEQQHTQEQQASSAEHIGLAETDLGQQAYFEAEQQKILAKIRGGAG